MKILSENLFQFFMWFGVCSNIIKFHLNWKTFKFEIFHKTIFGSHGIKYKITIFSFVCLYFLDMILLFDTLFVPIVGHCVERSLIFAVVLNKFLSKLFADKHSKMKSVNFAK